MLFPRWEDLDPEDQLLINNGCGSSWFSPGLKKFVDKYLFGWMFYAQCGHHDYGYIVGGGEFRRLFCDYRFSQEMLKDVIDTWRHKNYINAILQFIFASLFSLMVFLFGWCSFEYGDIKDNYLVILYARNPGKKTNFFNRIKKFKFK